MNNPKMANLLTATVSGLVFGISLGANAQTTPTIKRPSIDAPKVAAPAPPTVGSPGGARTQDAAGTTGKSSSAPAVPKAALVTKAFDQTAYTTVSASGAAVLLLFSAPNDAVWLKQAPVLQTILRESEFRNIPQFQIDMSDSELTGKLGVTMAGTIVVMKDGIERIRSTKMTNADVIRKMLRLTSAL